MKFEKISHISDDIELFLLDTNKNSLEYDFNIIPKKQKIEIQTYKFENDRFKRLLARSFLYHYLNDRYNINNFELEYGAYKKPMLKDDYNIGFSISYSNNHILVGISEVSNIGVDIEYIDSNINHLDLKSIIMHDEEISYYNSLKSHKEQLHFFFDVFNIKESIIKCLGTGLYYDVKKINILDISIFSDYKVDNLSTNIILNKLMPEYKVSVCKTNNSFI
ncbi:4'-phosphopantetheinyl transferase superfamily protein [Francisella philomiragia subsp. philomiragia ATCC 25015]|uniref:4'-phosphopantetheinyl transferase family protein n=1 Tax=Francisella philomiragia TaxID=28110 RepID=UPI0001AF771B|nr:4'-phosphopantetheinyl transferase superfamily protein [Francisella philomiragia]AJI74489.1 4'-phosphopantetheinyl transferase superfamily protein [Francisella philomiragia subsp. philomiragia ATCC 25015]EET21818.1 predicted protein [Francisella philomiragia subsp. philomiragia ATCC 25015]MBK2238988.1 4'-phosphopantetheinyl transferase superfamily protein [Francisella philomiragia]